MRLSATLTIGWPDDAEAPFAAPALDATARAAATGRDGKVDNARYHESLAEQVAANAGHELSALEATYRMRGGGARPLSRLVSALAAMPAPDGFEEPLACRIDAFAYGHVSAAKNYDLFMPVGATSREQFRRTRADWSRTIAALEAFERAGAPLGTSGPVTADRYLALREIVARPTARDERRSLVALLLSGPSTLADLAADLGLNYPLGSRTVAVFEAEAVGVVERRPGDVFALRTETLALVLFCLRETMGHDVLSALPGNES